MPETEAELYARIGRQAVRIDQLDAMFAAVLNLFADVLGGKLDPRRVLINRTSRTVEVAPDGFSAVMPATINGLPECEVYRPFAFPEPTPASPEG
jgi:hypothetical protein